MSITTCRKFIHEYSMFDDVIECIEEATMNVELAMARYEVKKHQIESKQFFEASTKENYEYMLEKEGEGVLEKIGNAVISIIKGITDFIKKIGDKITGSVGLAKSDREKVNHILSEHPELQNKVLEGIDKKWFTISDVAKFEKDVIGLIHMLEKSAIDNQTFMDKFKARCEAFTNSAKPILGAATTIIGFMKIIPDIHKACSDSKKSLISFRGTLEKFKDDINNNYGNQNASKAQAIFNALSQAVGLTTKECKLNNKSSSMAHDILSSFSKTWMGKKLKVANKLSKMDLEEKANRAVAKWIHGSYEILNDKKSGKTPLGFNSAVDTILDKYLGLKGNSEAKSAVIRALRKEKYEEKFLNIKK